MQDIFSIYDNIQKLKNLKRKGWVIKGIQGAESVAEHSFGVAVLSAALAKKLSLDQDRCIKLALFHDFAESIINDITPHDNVLPEDKNRLEEEAFSSIIKESGFSWIGPLWQEYSENKTREAKLVHDMDKIEMLLQAKKYEETSGKNSLDEFFSYAENKLSLQESKELYQEIIKRRESQ